MIKSSVLINDIVSISREIDALKHKREKLLQRELSRLDGEWTSCSDAMPYEKPHGGGTASKWCMVLYSSGKTKKDMRINGNWIWYCEKTVGKEYGEPLAWKYVMNGEVE